VTPAWRRAGRIQAAALPVVIAPIADELLLGVGLRCDLANGFTAGSTLTMTARFPSGPSTYGRPGFSVTGSVFDEPELAGLLGWPISQVRETTYRDALTRLFGPKVESKRLGRLGSFRICPACISDFRLIRRETILPWVEQCPVHRIQLISDCSCGIPLRAHSSGQEPFHCPDCWSDWGSLPRVRLDPWEDLRQRRIIHAYRTLIVRGDDTLPARIASATELDGPRRWDYGWSTRPFALERLNGLRKADLRSLASFVAAIVVREIPPERLFEPRPLRPRDRRTCGNTGCAFSGRPGSMRLNGIRPNGAESYCAECGSRYIGDRMILAFDLEHGGTVHPLVVAAARARLALFHERLPAACLRIREVIPEGSIHVGHVFREAGIPNARYLRARRLGLVQATLVLLGRSVSLDPDCVVPDPSPRWNSPRGRDDGPPHARPGPRPRPDGSKQTPWSGAADAVASPVTFIDLRSPAASPVRSPRQ
jgi:hypothetical protein